MVSSGLPYIANIFAKVTEAKQSMSGPSTRLVARRFQEVVDEIYDEFVAKKMGIDQKGQICVQASVGSRLFCLFPILPQMV